ncbi:MAG: MucB/RseB C-terminal domain-containing protein [Gammaproteobacteria bacterium]|nr:MucB/RseB C-terminal domain-containing protein [Gammaproteobacteria bacterium]
MKLISALRTCRLCSIVLAAASVTNGVLAEEGVAPTTPADWLRAMDHAFRNLNYDGVFEYSIASHSQIRIQNRRGDRALSVTADVAHDITVASFRIVHMVIDGVEHERIAHRGGPRREILRTGGQVSYVLPADDKSFALAADLPTGPYPRRFMRSEDLSAHYRFGLSGRDSVIGRPAVCLEVHPLDDNRYGFLLWLDEETGLLLRSELRDANGLYLERVEFLSLKVGDSVSADALQPEIPGVRIRSGVETSETPAAPTVPVSWKIGWVPAGFRITDAHPHEARKGVHVMFSDGLATFSVFIEAAPQSAAGGVFSRNGATVLLSHDLTGELGDYLVTVVGEVPPETAHRVAESVFRGQ